MQCDRCGGEEFTRAGRDRQARQLYRCRACGRRLTTRSSSAFNGYRFPDDIIALAVRWYLRFRLPYADVAELLAERGVHVDPSTIFDWVQHFTPLYQEAARSRRRGVGLQWSIDETYIRFQTLPCAQVVCAGHGFMRNLRNGFYDLGVGCGDGQLPQAPRLVRAWDELTIALAAA